MNFEEKIKEARSEVDRLKSDIAELIGMAEVEERDLSDEESIRLEAMSDDVEKTTKRVADLERAEKALGMSVVREKGGDVAPKGPAIISRQSKSREKGDLLFKHATTAFLAHVENKAMDQVARERYSHDPDVETIVKAAVNPAMTDVSGWAAELTDDAIQGFQDLLRGDSAAAATFAVAGLNLSFDGYTAIKIPARQGGTTDLAPSWSGEGDAIPVKRGTFGQHVINPFKWGVISTFSKELAIRSTPQIESLIRQFIIADAGTQLDANFFSPDVAVAGVRPDGVLQGVTGTPASTGGSSPADDMTTDLRNLISPIVSADMGRTLRIYMHPSIAIAMGTVLTATGVYLFRDELAQGRIMGIPVIQSTNLPTDELIAIDCAEMAVAQTGAGFDVSDTATIVEYNDDDQTDPHMTPNTHPRTPNEGSVDAAINAADAASGQGPVRSLYQTHSVAVKMTQYISWHRMRTGCVNRITGIAY